MIMFPQLVRVAIQKTHTLLQNDLVTDSDGIGLSDLETNQPRQRCVEEDPDGQEQPEHADSIGTGVPNFFGVEETQNAIDELDFEQEIYLPEDDSISLYGCPDEEDPDTDLDMPVDGNAGQDRDILADASGIVSYNMK